MALAPPTGSLGNLGQITSPFTASIYDPGTRVCKILDCSLGASTGHFPKVRGRFKVGHNARTPTFQHKLHHLSPLVLRLGFHSHVNRDGYFKGD